MRSLENVSAFGQAISHFSEVSQASDSALRKSGNPEAWRRIADDFAKRLAGSHRFAFPGAGSHFIGENITYSETHISLTRLPYDRVALFHLFADDTPSITIYEQESEKHGQSPGAIHCYSACKMNGTWALDGWLSVLDLPSFYETGGVPIEVYPALHGLPSPVPDDLEDKHRYVENLRLAAIVDLCCALACTNVNAKGITFDSKKNNKRAKKGKPRLFDYKILEVETSDKPGRERSGAGGAGKSPRTHLRRGHIRRIGGDRIIWVNSCVVRGKTPGIVHKDYSVV